MEHMQILKTESEPIELDTFDIMQGAIQEASTRCHQSADDVGKALRQLDLATVFADSNFMAVKGLLFMAAQGFAATDIDQTWQELSSICDVFQSSESPIKNTSLALPSSSANWVNIQLGPSQQHSVLLDHRDCFIPNELYVDVIKSKLLGFNDGQMATFSCEDKSNLEKNGISIEDKQIYLNSHATLLLGVISGACQYIVDEAYAYARQRQSGGKAIIHHQAVALRLADLTIHSRSLSLFSEMLVSQMGAEHDSEYKLTEIAANHISELAFKITRDALQTAAAHGFVSGLPFRATFEKMRTLTALLTLVAKQYKMEKCDEQSNAN